ncbi:MAG TPA: pyruvate formate lyase family protein [Smithella sp.]|nr:pyruvate formate lyase family protein [Smithella sp.]HQH17249.1 pyruvate formate lyase family protein [Smithella sp.]HQI73451.1 pyruvate formate lyase family protein [Smithella sp.]
MQESAGKTIGGYDRIMRLKSQVQEYPRGICTERALLWTEYFKNRKNRRKPTIVQMAEALRHVLLNKSVNIYPDELIVGNYTSLRVGGIIYPELHGVPVLLEIFSYSRRAVNPLRISLKDQIKLARILPFWLNRFIVTKAFPNIFDRVRFSWEQLRAKDYYIYEVSGISHLAPDHAKLIALGTDAIKKEIEKYKSANTDPEKEAFYEAVTICVETLALFGERYADCARKLADSANDPARRADLLAIEDICRHVPRRGARTFREAIQALFFLHIAIFQEYIGETICPGRVDQILYPYYRRDIEAGILTPEEARELLAAFCIKLCETIPVLSQSITNMAGGMTSWQVVTMGGTDRDGKDATNDLSYMLLSIADELRMRQPNFHARIHAGTPGDFIQAIHTALANGSSSPSLFNDEIIVPTMISAGYDPDDARDYVAIGCVEPVAPGKTIGSTDAAILNVPLAMEYALNQGRRFGSMLRTGAKTAPVEEMQTMDDVAAAFTKQLEYLVGRMVSDLNAVGRAHAVYHPTPLTSLFIDGCLASGICSTNGGAKYNSPGVQGVGMSTAGDSLCAIERLVFQEKKISLVRLRDVLSARDADPYWFALMRKAPKFGNNDESADYWTRFVVNEYARIVRAQGKNTRGGQYQAGIYSNTAHVHFGKNTGALPCGRPKGGSFPSGMAPQNGMDRSGVTALINSMNTIDYRQIANGINFNLKFEANSLNDEQGRNMLASLINVYFKRGGMQVQLNVLDSTVLRKAKENPDQYPFLLVRISGYSVYFSELSPELQDEIIARTSNRA